MEINLFPEIAPGLRGTKVETATEIMVSYAEATDPGSGAMEAFITSLPPHKTCRAIAVTNQYVVDLLLANGFTRRGLQYVREPLGEYTP